MLLEIRGKYANLCFTLALCGSFFVGNVWSRSSGPPSTENFERVCSMMLPDHNDSMAQPASQNGGYLIDTDLLRLGSNTSFSFTAGQAYRGRKMLQ